MSKEEPVPDHDHYDEVFRALADSTRRHVLVAVANRELTVTEVARAMRPFSSRTAVSRHLAVLRQAGLVEEEPATDGRLHYRKQLGSDYMIKRAFASLLKMWDR